MGRFLFFALTPALQADAILYHVIAGSLRVEEAVFKPAAGTHEDRNSPAPFTWRLSRPLFAFISSCGQPSAITGVICRVFRRRVTNPDHPVSHLRPIALKKDRHAVLFRFMTEKWGGRKARFWGGA
jgi:hypothetical protein